MNLAIRRLRQIALALLFIVAAVWIWSAGGQWLLRWRAQHLLNDVRSLNPSQNDWTDAQRMMATWSRFGTTKGPCSAEFCNYEVDLVQALPSILTGDPAPNSHNWVAHVAILLGIRAAAARGGFTVHQGVLTSKWFGEQVTVPIRDWEKPENYVPYLSVSAREAYPATVPTPEPGQVHPVRLMHHEGLQFDFSFTAQEPEVNRSAFYDFNLNCITRFRPCETPADMLPDGWTILQQK